MSLKDTLRQKLTPELFTQVTDALGDDFNFDVVPRSRLNKVIGQRDTLKEQLEAAMKGTQTSRSSGNSDDDDDDDDFQMPDLTKGKGKGKTTGLTQEEVARQIEEATKNARTEMTIQFAGLDALRNANAVDPDLVFTLIDKSKLKLDDSGKLTGMEEQITALKASKPNLFPTDDGKCGRKNTPGGTGKDGGSDKFETVKSKEDFLKLSTADQIKFKEAHPDVFKSYLAQ